MFKSDQVISATYMLKHFPRISARLENSAAPLLIVQRNKRFLVLVSAEIFEDLVEARFGAGRAEEHGDSAGGI
ncbi:MAG: type II toxin-antitoxin system Phd/YefM family antitoxin [Oligoflexia bacterium]|nr:type II toxin-antitoxin system Phd/YefM family antitoxin [Oligoflexia bacterium]